MAGFAAPAIFFSTLNSGANVPGALEAVEHCGAGKFVAHGLAVVYLVVPFARLVPRVDVRAMGADLEVQYRGPAVAQGELVGPGPVVVPVGVDKPRRHHMAGGIDGFLAGDLVLGDDGDLAALDADVGDRVIIGFRVHDPAVVDDQVVVVRRPEEEAAAYICTKHKHKFRRILSKEIVF